MSRRVLQLESQHPIIFDGLKAEVWVITMRNNVDIAYMRNMMPGVFYTVNLQQDQFGGHRFTWPSGCFNAATIDPTPGSVTTQNFIADSQRQLFANMTATWTKETTP
jgi:hypothetical protein